ncbi:hypothetical protein BRADI_1g69125v3 [Brachypodium distachyon]|uniref:Uncharacterized protein n=1 Tax=Brachypodium distachyon TaxID=15368 RepID=A0A0Q3HIG4_BRADI|nr:hypothetical protein BRADI_1g69125v3 [Brachypodium distachyon]
MVDAPRTGVARAPACRQAKVGGREDFPRFGSMDPVITQVGENQDGDIVKCWLSSLMETGTRNS